MTVCQFSLMLAEGGCEPVETRKTAARPWEIDDELWARIEPLLPVVPRNPRRPGRKRLDSRKVLCGILFVLYTGVRWEFLPQELGFGSGMTCWRRLRDWNEAGVWQRLHELLLSELRAADLLTGAAARGDPVAGHLNPGTIPACAGSSRRVMRRGRSRRVQASGATEDHTPNHCSASYASNRSSSVNPSFAARRIERTLAVWV